MNKIPYTERVRLLAAKMAQYSFFEKYGDCGEPSNEYINSFGSASRIAVAEMKDMAACLLHSRFIREGYLHAQAGKMVDKELKFQGLIPDTEQEAAPHD